MEGINVVGVTITHISYADRKPFHLSKTAPSVARNRDCSIQSYLLDRDPWAVREVKLLYGVLMQKPSSE